MVEVPFFEINGLHFGSRINWRFCKCVPNAGGCQEDKNVSLTSLTMKIKLTPSHQKSYFRSDWSSSVVYFPTLFGLLAQPPM